ncbi:MULTISPECIES: hypothetical protein [unclassified Nonomuraea]|uniref:hypothetical protein n=1 Tax=unclassified Nonomuraea TaxID=2593643 RepID=UPI00191C6C4A|nr:MULTISPECIES: hypothetical protein [unclassified Nonomuraea]
MASGWPVRFISISYLHRVFQEEGLRVTAWIKAQRLERVRHDLADPAFAPISTTRP